MHINPDIIDLKPYQPGKTEQEIMRTYRLDRVVKLASNENPLGPSPMVQQALQQSQHAMHRYPEDAAPELKQLIADKHHVAPECISFGSGSSELLEMIVRAFVGYDGELLTTEHSFILYRILAKAIGAKLTSIADNDFHQDINGLISNCSKNTRAVIIANPNNPTGTWLNQTQLENLLNNIDESTLVIIDEAYVEYMDDPNYVSASKYLQQHNNLIVLRSFSKAYALGGLRFGYAVSSAAIANIFARIRKPFNVSSAALIAAQAAIQDHQHLLNSQEVNRQGLDYLHAELQQLGVSPIAKSGNFVSAKFGAQSQKIATSLLEQGIIIRPLAPYAMHQHLRISVGTMDENRAFIKALKPLLTSTP